MSLLYIRQALEGKLAEMTPALATAYENKSYTPVEGIPYQRVTLLPAIPDNTTKGDGHYREQGIFQISLLYPIKTGPSAATTRAIAIQVAFKRGTSITVGGIMVRINKTPAIWPGYNEGDRWHLPVKIPYFAEIFD